LSVPGTYLTGWRWLRGRASRGEYAVWLTVILPWSYFALWAQNGFIQAILSWALLFHTIRRLHDIDLSGWWIAAGVLVAILLASALQSFPDEAWPYLAASLFPWLCLLLAAAWPGSRSENRFGPKPAMWPWMKPRPSA
jgi:uncharacterized membrane protein YhaH (DUF805 family)